MATEEWIANVDEIMKEIRELLIKKQQKYGKYNISKFGEKGVLIRSNDKIERLTQLIWNNVPEPLDETIEDTWRDLAGYSIIGLMVRRNKW